MTEQEEAVGRQRLGELTKHQARLIQLKTDKDVIFPEGNERHDLAVVEYDKLVAVVGRLDVDPSIPPVRLMDAEQAVTDAQERKAEAEKQLASHQAAVDKATTEVTEAQSALTALTPPTR